MKKLKSRAIIFALHFFAALPLPVARLCGRVLGRIAWWTRQRMATTTLTNLELCFPACSARERHALARQSLEHTFQAIAETGAVWLWPAAKTLDLVVEVEGLALLRSAYEEGKGVIALGPHLGNWEIVGLYLNTVGCGQTHQMYQAPDDPKLDSITYAARSRSGANMVPTDTKGVAQLLQALRRGEIVGILPDQVPPDNGGEFAPFFGLPALTMTLLNRLQQKTGARVIVTYARRIERPRPGFRIVYQQAHPDIYAEHMPTALAGLNASVEAVVRQIPEQYQWEYKRFKRQPEGRPRPY